MALGNKLQMYRTIILAAALMLAGCNQYGIGWDAMKAELDAKHAVERHKLDAERAETNKRLAEARRRRTQEMRGQRWPGYRHDQGASLRDVLGQTPQHQHH
jgi:hypothetical protein